MKKIKFNPYLWTIVLLILFIISYSFRNNEYKDIVNLLILLFSVCVIIIDRRINDN